MKRYASLSMMALFLMAGAAFAGGQTTTPTTDHGQHKPAAADADFTKLDANKWTGQSSVDTQLPLCA